MSAPVLQDIEDLFCRWTALRDDRLACGELRPSDREAVTFSEYVGLLERLDQNERDQWNVRREEVMCRPPLPRCTCGHPEALHVEGSCYALVGCSTACDCRKVLD